MAAQEEYTDDLKSDLVISLRITSLATEAISNMPHQVLVKNLELQETIDKELPLTLIASGITTAVLRETKAFLTARISDEKD